MMTKTATWNNETGNMTEWAAKFGVSSTYVTQTINKKGGVAPAFAFLATGRKRKLANTLIEYTGPDFTTSTGEQITKGQKETLAGWETVTGINKCTIRSRAARGGNTPAAINAALRSPLRSSTPLPGRFQPAKFTTPKPARSTLSILRCRAANPGQRCTECETKRGCYGVEA